MKSEEAQLKEKPKDSNNIHYSKTSIDNLPFDVSKDLDQFKRILVSKEFDYFKGQYNSNSNPSTNYYSNFFLLLSYSIQ